MKRLRFTVIYGLMLCTAAVLLLLDTFVIPHREAGVIEMQPSHTGNEAGVIETQPQDEDGNQANGAMTTVDLSPSPISTRQPQPAVPAEPVVTATSYRDSSMAINLQTLRKDETTYYVADITLSDATLLSTAFGPAPVDGGAVTVTPDDEVSDIVYICY